MVSFSSQSRVRAQGGFTLFSLVFWAVLIGMVFYVGLRVMPTLNEYFTIKRTIEKIVHGGGTTVPQIRSAFERQKDIEYAITSIGGKDLQITKENDAVVISFAYNKEVDLFGPVFLLIKYEGHSKGSAAP
jgi:Domain of unknown function (DUF4845)